MGAASDIIEEFFNKDPNVKRILFPSPQELAGLDETLDRVRAKYECNVTDSDAAFQYACLLIMHCRASYIEEGVRLMESLLYTSWKERLDNLAGSAVDKTRFMAGGQVGFQTDVVRGKPVHGASAPPEQHDCDEEEELQSKSEVGIEEKERDTGRKSASPTDDLLIQYYYLTVGWIKLRNYDTALTCVNRMLQLQPDHRQAVALKQYIDAEVNMTLTATGLAGVGAVAAVAAIIGLFLRKS
ncbi:hypothetical protein TraAM80_06421 [Trypanosoma rangeli]|uniref:Mitochondrial fission 1 protein n=1 Tax=Trypanosoma rangeli TaxID=5698 RepID=A0A422NA81_TRYRA|nr:uncharacterized protein TraAM80_06421 [Trypanosoma rangeli]RNF02389.1 hypothetical protein TraAM80_06421 [Trypanosoma rangeli]|eukprot:RNF02389.1 hypothetical protein TraAM80_06421 [Trypanosoma rangeli]